MDSTPVRAVAVGRARRKPKRHAAARVCAAEGCETRLSRYNGTTNCFSHAPVKYPRLRGEFTDEWAGEH